MNDRSEKYKDLERKLAELPADDPERRLLEALFDDESLSHEEAQALLPDYVTDELLGYPVRERYPRLHRHLLHCQECAEMYAAMMRDLTEAFPQPAVMPQPDLSFLAPTLQERLDALLADVRGTTKRALQTVVASNWPGLQEDIDLVLRVLFRQMDKFGEDFVLQSHAAQAMGFGPGEALISQQMGFAIQKSLLALRKAYEGKEASDPAILMKEAKGFLEEAAQEAGLSGETKERFINAYLAWFAKELGI